MTDFYGFPGGGAESAWNFDVNPLTGLPAQSVYPSPAGYPGPTDVPPMMPTEPGASVSAMPPTGGPAAFGPPQPPPAPMFVPGQGVPFTAGAQPGSPMSAITPAPGGMGAGDVPGMGMPGGPNPLGRSLEPTYSAGPQQHANPIEGAEGGSAGQAAGGPMDIRSGAQRGQQTAAAAQAPNKTQETIKRLQEFMKAIQPAPRDVVKPGTPGLPREQAMPASTIGQIAALSRGAAPPQAPAQLYLSRLLQGRG